MGKAHGQDRQLELAAQEAGWRTLNMEMLASP